MGLPAAISLAQRALYIYHMDKIVIQWPVRMTAVGRGA
jgi:hypothetical protein